MITVASTLARMGSGFGRIFRVTTFGESHGAAVGCVVEGCPPGLPIERSEIQRELDRRRPGQSSIVSQRKESDSIEILSGVEDGRSLGSPIAILVRNADARPRDYEAMRDKFRPSHADFAYHAKYGLRAASGGGRASARETIGRVAAGAIAKRLLRDLYGAEVLGWVERVKDVSCDVDPLNVSFEEVESNAVRCPDASVAARMVELIESVRKQGDSVGGVVFCRATDVPAGWGDPVFDKLEADLAKGVMSLPACKGFEIGSGFAGSLLTGAEHNDAFRSDDAHAVYTTTNNSGGVQGGISNGMPIFLRATFKPTSTIAREQDTVNDSYENTTIAGRGRHDPCVLPRAVPMVEAMVALVLADHALRQEAVAHRLQAPVTPNPQ